MGSIVGGPQVTKVPPPQALFPGLQKSYVDALQSSGIQTAGLDTLKQTAQTGLPTNVGPAFDAYKASMQQNINEGARNLKEQFGAGGLSGGSDILHAGADYQSNVTSQLNNTLAQWAMSAQESAANRRVGAATTGLGLVSEPALGFAPSAVVSQSPGLLGGIGSLLSAFFPGGFSDIANLFKGGGGGGGTGGQMVAPPPFSNPFPSGPNFDPFDPTLGGTFDPNAGGPDPTGYSTVNLDFGAGDPASPDMQLIQ